MSRRLRIEITDEAGSVRDGDYSTDTIIAVEASLPGNVEIPGERLLEGMRRAYEHVVGSDLPPLNGPGE